MTARLAIVTAVLVVLTAWTHTRPEAAAVDPVDFAAVVPLTFGTWVGRDAPPLDPDVARVLAADQYVHRYYGWQVDDSTPRADGTGSRPSMDSGRPEPVEGRVADVEADIAYYARPQAGAAMHSPLACLPGNGWQVIASSGMPLAVNRQTVTVRQLTIGRGADRIAMTYWFQNRGAVVGNEYAQRLQLLTNGARGRATDAALVRAMARDTADGRIALERFTRDLVALLVAAF